MKERLITLIIFILILLLAACNMPQQTTSAEQTAMINTSVAQTVASRAEETSQATIQLPTQATDTPQSQAEDTPQPTETPIPDTPTPTETPIPCNSARFISDITIPDGTEFEPGESFTKTWSLKNIGSCSWTSGYDIIFFGGDSLGAPSSVQITNGTINTGQTVQVSVNLTAPSSPGTYRGNWQLRDPSDVIFGIENSTSGFFWVEIVVPAPTPTATLDPQL
jgi:hypothetical protein